MISKSIRFAAVGAVLSVGAMLPAGQASAATCKGEFVNPISDICWSCMFPIRIGGMTLVGDDDKDFRSGGDLVCECGSGLNIEVGVTVSFWEPIRRVDVVREPFCMASLGGVSLDPGFDAPEHGRHETGTSVGTGMSSAFYQAHYYLDPVLHWLEVVQDNPCLEKSPFDVAYLTEVDPMWNDDEMAALINPDGNLFANMASQMACGADCVAASTGFPKRELYWCSGCQGGIYPLTGNVPAHTSGPRSASLLVTRLLAKLHRQGVLRHTHGEENQCSTYGGQLPLLDKRAYKYSMLYPVPQTEKINGECCQTLGRTTQLWASGKEFPYEGEDFSFEIFRARDCCQGAFGVGDFL